MSNPRSAEPDTPNNEPARQRSVRLGWLISTFSALVTVIFFLLLVGNTSIMTRSAGGRFMSAAIWIALGLLVAMLCSVWLFSRTAAKDDRSMSA